MERLILHHLQKTPMVTKTILYQAKAFLCWDTFPDLSIQLVEFKEATSYFYPPSQRSSIVVYYQEGKADFSVPLFLLFHEAGHCLQFEDRRKANEETTFWENAHVPTGSGRARFEEEGWNRGKVLFKKFIARTNLNERLLDAYEKYAKKSMESYL